MQGRRGEQGFSLLELMVAVVVMGILAALVLPSWGREKDRGSAKSEVVAVFAELTQKEMSYQTASGYYYAAAACPSSSTGVAQAASACTGSGGAWEALALELPQSSLYCSYKITTGTSSQTPMPPSGFSMPQPATTWFFISATCKLNGTTYKYFTSSVDSTIQGT
jgi:prepilin-type N-terminal cleavage/methylation domain-containing protein